MLRAATDPSAFSGRCLLSTLNTTVMELNEVILIRLPGQVQSYQSVDTHVTDADTAEEGIHQLPVETLQKIYLPSLPPSQLCLKVGSPILL